MADSGVQNNAVHNRGDESPSVRGGLPGFVRQLMLSPGWFFVLIALVDVILIYFVLAREQVGWYEEGALMENVQAGAMAASAFMLLFTGFRVHGLDCWLVSVFALTCWAFFLREVDVEDLDVPQLVILVGSGIGRDLSIGGAYVVLGVIFLKFFRSHMLAMPRLLWSRIAMVVVCGCVFLVLGAVFEPLGQMFWEELVELNGTLLIFWGACLCARNPTSLTQSMLP